MSGRFFKLPQKLASRKDISSPDKIVWAAIADHEGQNSHSWPGVTTLARECGLARGTVIASIRHLEKASLLVVDRRGNGRSNHYKTSLNVEPIQTLDRSKSCTPGSLRLKPEPVQSLDPNQTDLLNQTAKEGDLTFAFVVRDGNNWQLPIGKIDQWRKTFPDIDIEAELQKAAQWLIDNPDRSKTAKGMSRFLNGWLSRSKPGANENSGWSSEAEQAALQKYRRPMTDEEACELMEEPV